MLKGNDINVTTIDLSKNLADANLNSVNDTAANLPDHNQGVSINPAHGTTNDLADRFKDENITTIGLDERVAEIKFKNNSDLDHDKSADINFTKITATDLDDHTISNMTDETPNAQRPTSNLVSVLMDELTTWNSSNIWQNRKIR